MLVPKERELVANPYRFSGDGEKAKAFFEEGLRKALAHMRKAQHPEYPLTLYYAFKQAESDEEDVGEGALAVASTGWETMLEGLLKASFTITGTWPMRTESPGRAVARGANVLASSIVLVCRPRPESAPIATRREFIAALRRKLPNALKELLRGSIAPVDLAQAAIGPGMAIFSRYSKVLEADGSPMTVRTALQIINRELDTYLAAQEGELDEDTRFCLAWFEQFGLREAPFGEADVLARAKNTSVEGLADAGVLWARGGKVRLLKRGELPADWDPRRDRRVAVWECVQHAIRRLDAEGEGGAARLLGALGGSLAEAVRTLAYRLYTIAERRGWADEALAYNTLVVSWPRLLELSSGQRVEQGELL